MGDGRCAYPVSNLFSIRGLSKGSIAKVVIDENARPDRTLIDV